MGIVLQDNYRASLVLWLGCWDCIMEISIFEY